MTLVAAREASAAAVRRGRWLWGGAVLALVVVGVVLAPTYGKSWDEYVHVVYAEQTIETYQGVRDPTDTLFNLRYYGPFYSVVVESLRGVVQRLAGWDSAAARHFLYYLSFLLGAGALYRLARRYVGAAAALGGAALFLTQPVLFGHAFINPKDTPFLGFFAAAMSSGLYAASTIAPRPGESRMSWREAATAAWRTASPRLRVLVVSLAGLCLLAAFEFFVAQSLLDGILRLVEGAYTGEAGRFWTAVFERVAQDAYKTPLEAYLDKAATAYLRLRWPATFGLAGLSLALLRRIFTDDSFRGLWHIAGAGAIAGLSAAVRIQGLFAAGLVSIVLLIGLRRRALSFLALYWAILAAVVLLGWPFLWGDPFRRFLEALNVMRSFGWGGEVLYRGAVYSSNELPWTYLWHLLLIQLTLPALALGLTGIALALGGRWSERLRAERWILLAWLILPVAYLSLPGLDVYDNFRQVLFVLPPLFVFAALGFQWLFDRLRRPRASAALALLSIAPGLATISLLHPYEYIYYNSLVGGVSGAYRAFELDYWCVSAREGAERLNPIAWPGAVVAINKDSDTLVPYLREDVVVVADRDSTELAKAADPDFMIVCTRAHADLLILPGRPIALEVEAGGVPILTIKRVP